MDFIELARSRYSCKKFDSRQISKEQLDSILEAGRLAPTAKKCGTVSRRTCQSRCPDTMSIWCADNAYRSL